MDFDIEEYINTHHDEIVKKVIESVEATKKGEKPYTLEESKQLIDKLINESK